MPSSREAKRGAEMPQIFWLFRKVILLFSLTMLAGNASAQATDHFHRYEDSSGFSCDFPQSWDFGQSQKGDRVFGDKTGKYPEATIIIQVIDRSLAKFKTNKEQLDDLANQIRAVPDGAIVSQSTAPFAGQDAPYFIATYTTKDTKGVSRPFKHVQAVVTAEKYFLLMSYSAPTDEFDTNLKVFQNCAATMQLAKPPETKAGSGQIENLPPVTINPQSTAKPPKTQAEPNETRLWYSNKEEGFWLAAPSDWVEKATPGDVFSLEMSNPKKLEGIIVWRVTTPKSVKSSAWADAWEEHLSGKVFFMAKRVAAQAISHPGSGLRNTTVIIRQYQGEEKGTTVRSLAAYVTSKTRAYTIVGYYFLGDEEAAERIRQVILSFRLAPPQD
jgi:hypothetical protein